MNTSTTGCGSPPVLASRRRGDPRREPGRGHTGFGALADIGTAARGVAHRGREWRFYLDIVCGTYEGPVGSSTSSRPWTRRRWRVGLRRQRARTSQPGPTGHEHGRCRSTTVTSWTTTSTRSWATRKTPRPGIASAIPPTRTMTTTACPTPPITVRSSPTPAKGTPTTTAPETRAIRWTTATTTATVPKWACPGRPLFDEALAARAKWSQGDTHFVIRVDALAGSSRTSSRRS